MSATPWLLVLAGGSGTRFWPRSRARRPKQFLAIAGDEPLLLTTLRRFQGWVPQERMVVLATRQLEAGTKSILAAGGFARAEVLSEPESRNTAPTLVMAMEWLRARDPAATAMVVPADHWITEVQEYIAVMRQAVSAAEGSGSLCTVGVQPSRPETGYGYIRSGGAVAPHAFRVDRFVEKPSREVAETMVQSPEYLWNSGMFVWTCEAFFRELSACGEAFSSAFADYRREAKADSEEARAALETGFMAVPATSIDYALLEKSRDVIVVPGNGFGWNDLGSFVSLEEVYPKAEGGVARAGRVLALDSLANVVDVPGKAVALLGVTDMIIVDAGDVLLIAAKERAQDVKKLVERLRSEGSSELL